MLTKTQKEIVEALKAGGHIYRLKYNGEYKAYWLAFPDKSLPSRKVSPETMRVLSDMLESTSSVEAMGYVHRRTYTLKDEYK